ncbi:MAG: lptA [Nevskia sp.]|nr:lptA [Nevskia sp.]
MSTIKTGAPVAGILLAALLGTQALAQTAPAAAGSAPTTLTPPPKTTSKQLNQTKDELGKVPSGADLRPSGAINVTAKRAELIQGSSAVYTGDVVMDSDTLKLDGERLELKQFPGSQYVATLTGTPAHMSHPGTGQDNPPMTAHAKTIVYDSRSGIADLIGEAFVTKGEQNISADTIHYNVAQKGILASGGDDGRVHIVIPPAGLPTAAPATTPAPAGPGK